MLYGTKTNGIGQETKITLVGRSSQKKNKPNKSTPVSTAGSSFDTVVPITPVNTTEPFVSTANESEE
ncbi:hypothetical protein Tco_0973244 [Tanacetum coccineum]